ncbi:MAG: hypothetical protein K0R14_1931 [Burkholderiales bacterium]|jgi:hypothetical protein|nr:hypothetical protein [Burkholderiales bacterium]
MENFNQLNDNFEHSEETKISTKLDGYFILENIAEKKDFPVQKNTKTDYGNDTSYILVAPVKDGNSCTGNSNDCLVLMDNTPAEKYKGDISHNKVYVMSINDLFYLNRPRLPSRIKYIKSLSGEDDCTYPDLTTKAIITDSKLKIIGKLACVVKS